MSPLISENTCNNFLSSEKYTNEFEYSAYPNALRGIQTWSSLPGADIFWTYILTFITGILLTDTTFRPITFSSLEMVLNAKFKIPTGREILKCLPSARRKWNSETALENYCYLYGVGKASFDLIGVPLFREDVRTQHWFGLFSIPLISSHVMLVFYTIFYYNAEFENFLPCTCMAGIGLSVRKHCCN